MVLVDVLALIGIAASLLKGVDLFFSQHQKDVVQHFFEKIALCLDKLRPSKWLIKLKTSKWQRGFIIIAVIEFSYVLLMNLKKVSSNPELKLQIIQDIG